MEKKENKVLINKKIEIIIICSILVLAAVFFIFIVINLNKPVGFAFEIYIEQESDYSILKTEVGDEIPEDIKKQLIKYMQEHNLKIKPGHYWISDRANFEQVLEKIEFD